VLLRRVMLEKRQLISQLLQEFPEFGGRGHADSRSSEHNAKQYLDLSLFARFLTDELYEKENYQQVHAAFERTEEFLRHGTAEVRELVLGFFETLRAVASWKPYGNDAFIQFLPPESRRVWAKLDALWNLDLDDCSVLEREVLLWRVARQSLSHSSAIPQ
jgi:hypothetical protein